MNKYNSISISPFSSSTEKEHYLLSCNGRYYELFYWGKDKKWISLGKQKATGVMLQYRNVPKDALLFLHDETRGREEEVFFLKNGEQFFVNSLPID